MNHNPLMDALILCWPFALSLSGAVWYLYVLGYNVSVAVWVGIIARAGPDAEVGVMLYLNGAQRKQEARCAIFSDLTMAIGEGAGLRPRLITGLTLLVGLLPMVSGADVMKCIAAP